MLEMILFRIDSLLLENKHFPLTVINLIIDPLKTELRKTLNHELGRWKTKLIESLEK